MSLDLDLRQLTAVDPPSSSSKSSYYQCTEEKKGEVGDKWTIALHGHRPRRPYASFAAGALVPLAVRAEGVSKPDEVRLLLTAGSTKLRRDRDWHVDRSSSRHGLHTFFVRVDAPVEKAKFTAVVGETTTSMAIAVVDRNASGSGSRVGGGASGRSTPTAGSTVGSGRRPPPPTGFAARARATYSVGCERDAAAGWSAHQLVLVLAGAHLHRVDGDVGVAEVEQVGDALVDRIAIESHRKRTCAEAGETWTNDDEERLELLKSSLRQHEALLDAGSAVDDERVSAELRSRYDQLKCLTR
jgi:hypothetical protein